jgi:hypothetical protein
MIPKTAWFLAAVLVAVSLPVEAQGSGSSRRNRVDVARAQGVAPGHLPPANQCRLWYNNRPAGRQPAPMTCRQAEAIAGRDRHVRVVYGENVYRNARNSPYGSPGARYPETYPDHDQAVRRGTVRDPRLGGGSRDDGRNSRSYLNSPAFQTGYRDGMTKGREDAEDRDRFDPTRHSWYRSAKRGYENRYGGRADYQALYRQGFEAGYADGYRVYARR